MAAETALEIFQGSQAGKPPPMTQSAGFSTKLPREYFKPHNRKVGCPRLCWWTVFSRRQSGPSRTSAISARLPHPRWKKSKRLTTDHSYTTVASQTWPAARTQCHDQPATAPR